MTVSPPYEPTTQRVVEEQRPTCDLVAASEYTVEALTGIYNQTRIDYIVPMPMNPERLYEYIDVYDVDLARSVVALVDGEVLGLAMLGVRPGRTWITRLGVIPDRRRCGAGRSMMQYLLDQTRDLGIEHIVLEVIKNNVPAHTLFRRFGFVENRELLILRRPPGPPRAGAPPYEATLLGEAEALALLQRRQSVPSWLDETASLANAGGLAGISVELHDGGRGWLVFQPTVFQLGRLVVQTERGDPAHVAQALAHALHTHYPIHDTKTENVPADDPHLPGLFALRYFESFRRIEMTLDLGRPT